MSVRLSFVLDPKLVALLLRDLKVLLEGSPGLQQVGRFLLHCLDL